MLTYVISADIDDFIVSDQESEETGAVLDQEEGEGADGEGPDSGAHQQAPKRRRLRKAEPEEPEPERPDLEDSESDEETRAARSARLKGKQPAEPELLDDDMPGSSAMHARRAVARAPAWEAGRNGAPPANLEDDREAEELGGKQALHAGKRRRLHKAGGNAVTPEGGAARGAVGAQTRTRTLPSRPSAMDRLLQHQVKLQTGAEATVLILRCCCTMAMERCILQGPQCIICEDFCMYLTYVPDNDSWVFRLRTL